jgi:hypothetical protein
MAGNTSTIDLKVTGIAEIKKQLRELKGELASATDPEQMAELSDRAGELSDRLKDANEKVAVFAAGSPFEKTNNALGLMGSQLMSLDFEGAAESSKLFASAAKGINGDVIAKSLKGLGTVVGQVGKAFMSVGLSLLTNPIFLIAAAIAAIVAIIVLLMNKLGILKPILDAIGKVFGAIMVIIDAVVEGFKMLTDWLGLTAHAAEESAARQIAASEKTLEALERTSERRIDSMDHEIRLAKIAGEDVAVSEAKKQKYIIETTQIRIDELAKQVKLHERLGDLEDEDLKKLKDSLSEQKKALREAGQDFEALRAENKKKVEDNAKKVYENAKRVREEQRKEKEEEDLKRAEANYQAGKVALEMEQFWIDETERLRQEEIAAAKAVEDKKTADADEAAKFRAEIYAWETNKALEEDAKKEENRKKSIEAWKGMEEGAFDFINNLADIFTKNNEASQRKAFNVKKIAGIAQATIDTYQAASAAYTSQMAIPSPDAPFRAAIAAAFAVASGLARVKAIASTKFGGGTPSASGGGSGSAPSNSTQAATPNVSLFGQNNNANNLTSPQSEENTNQQMVVKAVVVESDITNAQTKANKYQNLASL